MQAKGDGLFLDWNCGETARIEHISASVVPHAFAQPPTTHLLPRHTTVLSVINRPLERSIAQTHAGC